MEVLYPRCCGLDVHKSSITACVLIAQSGKPLKHIRRVGCTTRELRELVVWLQEFVPKDHLGKYDILPMSVDTDPNSATRTRRGTHTLLSDGTCTLVTLVSREGAARLW
jgi:hypothetical protein